MNKTASVVELVVKKGLCVGCGACVYKCPNKALNMMWDDKGLLIPENSEKCCLDALCIKVCPFNPNPEEAVKTEDQLSKIYIKETNKYHKYIGNYDVIYAGFSNSYRLTSSSGGITTYFLSKLIEQKIVKYIISVSRVKKNSDIYYEYSISSNEEELLASSKTKYYPVSLDKILIQIKKLDGKVAIVGVGCFIKAIRLLQYYDPYLKEKIIILAGIICGGLKSKYFTEYLAAKAGVFNNNYTIPEYRVKNLCSNAIDYSFSCFDVSEHKEKSIKMSLVGDVWGTGIFKANACDYCDDVTTELADISIGDAWIDPYKQDGKGNNVIIIRTNIAKKIIDDGIKIFDLKLEHLTIDDLISSQKGSINHKRIGLNYRIKKANSKKIKIPPKRNSLIKINPFFIIVQNIRCIIKEKSFEIWKKSNKNSIIFDKCIYKYKILLNISLRFYHFFKKYW